MPTYMAVAFTNPVKGREQEYNDWYDNVAMPVYSTGPGCKPLGRYKLSDMKTHEFSSEDQWEYMSLYEFVTDDIEATIKSMGEHVANHKDYYFSESIDKTRFYEPIFVKL